MSDRASMQHKMPLPSSSCHYEKMPKTFQQYVTVPDDTSSQVPVRTYSCSKCRTQLANHDELISKSFQGGHGRAYLFNKVVNVVCEPAVERMLLTGLHSVCDIKCECCHVPLGWKYEHAFETSQKYKEGKFIIEVAYMIKDNNWSDFQMKSVSRRSGSHSRL